jgi:hypothetical protein
MEAVALLVNLVSVYIYTRRYWPYLVKSAAVHGPEAPRPGGEEH